MIFSFLAAHWRPIAVLVALVGAFAVGRFTTPGPDVVIAQSIRFVERKVEVKVTEKAKDRIVYRNVETRPDGTKIDHSIERTDTDVKAATNTTTDRNDASETKQTVTAYKPQWRVGALLGANWAGVHFDRPIGWDLLAAGAFAERRIAGPFFVGLWALSAGPSFGLTLSIEF
jgi:hypothetical protein